MLGLTQPFEAIQILMNYTVMEEGELRKGPWLEEEDDHLAAAVAVLGDRKWDALAKASGLRRNGKSCRLRWMNYLRPNLKHGNISAEEEETIIQLHKKWGNRWSKIARRLPGRTDNEIKNFWRSYSKKRATLVEKECSSSATNASSPSMEKDTCNGFFDETGVTRSPYEARLTDWILSNKEDFSNFNLYSPEWNISLWDGE